MIPILAIKDDWLCQNNTNTNRYDFYYHYQDKRNMRHHWCRWET